MPAKANTNEVQISCLFAMRDFGDVLIFRMYLASAESFRPIMATRFCGSKFNHEFRL